MRPSLPVDTATDITSESAPASSYSSSASSSSSSTATNDAKDNNNNVVARQLDIKGIPKHSNAGVYREVVRLIRRTIWYVNHKRNFGHIMRKEDAFDLDEQERWNSEEV